MAGFGKPQRVLVVLIPGPAKFGIVAFNPHSGPILATPHSILEELGHGEGDFRAGATLAHLNRQLSINIRGPVEALATLGVDKALVPSRRHHYNAIVCHFAYLL